MNKKRILFLANHFITLYSFRKELIDVMLAEGHQIYLSLPKSDENKYFEDLGCIIIDTEIDRRGINPIKDIRLLIRYNEIIKKINPDIIFSYTIKPNIYGSFISNKYGKKQICNITGTGATFLKNNTISKICKLLYKLSVKKCYKVYFQNTGDKDFFISQKMINDNYGLLPGSGCNLEQHRFKALPDDNEIKFIYIGRVMRLKGIDEYLVCAEKIHKKYPQTKFYIAGWNEEKDYMIKVEKAQKDGYVEYLGFRKDIDCWIEKCHCTILASYGGEGVPNVLLESAATGRVCIASKINGNSDVIEDGKTGFLFEKGNANDLIKKVELFIKLPFEKKSEMAYEGRKKIEMEFNRDIVINAYMKELYSI